MRSSGLSLADDRPLLSNLAALAQANRPVLLTLDIDGQPRYAVLYSVSHQNVELLVDGQLITFEREWLSSIWQGQYRHIWQSRWNETLKEGMKGEPIALLDTALSQVLGEPDSGSSLFDAELKRKVELFQRWQGLAVDGIAGHKTLRILEELAQQDAPTLQRAEENSNV